MQRGSQAGKNAGMNTGGRHQSAAGPARRRPPRRHWL